MLEATQTHSLIVGRDPSFEVITLEYYSVTEAGVSQRYRGWNITALQRCTAHTEALLKKNEIKQQ